MSTRYRKTMPREKAAHSLHKMIESLVQEEQAPRSLVRCEERSTQELVAVEAVFS
jgi:hypothetical protein